MGERRTGVIFLGVAVAYAVFSLVGRLTLTDRYALGLLWPGTGVAVLWLLGQRTRRATGACLASILVISVAVLGVTGLPLEMVAGLSLGAVLKAAVVATLFRRWCPGILGAGGEGSIHDLGVLLRSVVAGIVGTTLGLLPMVLGLLHPGAHPRDLVAWWGGSLAGLLLTGTVGHLLWEHVRARRPWVVANVNWVELGALWILTAAVLLRLGLAENASSFLVIAPAVWVAVRFSTMYAAVHVAVTGLVAVAITVDGAGPFAAIEDTGAAALTFQSFLLIVLLTTLTISSSRDGLRQADEEIVASAELFEAMSHAMTEGIVVVDRDGQVQRMNGPAQALIGSLASDEDREALKVRSTTGEPISVSQHPSRRALAAGEVVSEEVLLTRRDGQERVLEVTASPLGRRTHGSRAPAAVVVYRDVTQERHHAELLDAMYEAMTEGMLVVDAAGEFTQQNGAARRLLAQTEAAGSTNIYDYSLQRPDGTPLPPGEHPSVRARAEGRAITQDVLLPLANGHRRILAITAAPLTGGIAVADPGTLKVYRDVTDERRHASQLADFAAVVAHDLRSPLSALGGWLDLAAEQTEDPDSVQWSLGKAQKSLDRADQLIRDLLSQATAEGGELDPQPVVLDGPEGLLEEAAGVVDPGHAADIATQGSVPEVCADQEMLTQLLINLIGNALKYVASGTRPRVRLAGRLVGERVELDLTDNGIGIPEDQRDLVFERFHRAHSADERYAGTGLGLAICRTIVERHGGRIVALPGTDGIGTTFRFDLPAN